MAKKKHKEKMMMSVQRPSNLDYQKLITDYPPQIKNFKLDKMKLLVDVIYDRITYDQRNFNDQDGNFFIPLHSEKLQGIVSDYHLYMPYLEQANVIERTKGWQAGVKSRGYRFTEVYQTKAEWDTIEDYKVIQNYKAYKESQREKARQQYPHLISWFDGLQIDEEKAKQYIEDDYERKIKGNPSTERRQKPTREYNAYLRMVYNIVSKRYYFTLDDKGFRLHTVLTTLKKELRNFITYQGKPLVAIDLSCSQPFLSTRLFDPLFYDKVYPFSNRTEVNATALVKLSHLPFYNNYQYTIHSTLTNFENLLPENWEIENVVIALKNFTTIVVKFSYNNNKNDDINNNIIIKNDINSNTNRQKLTKSPFKEVKHPMSEKTHVDGESDLTEWAIYVQQVANGSFYEYIQTCANRIDPSLRLDRSKVKTMTITAFFAQVDFHEDQAISKKHLSLTEQQNLFRKVFPKIFRLFQEIKFLDHALLALLLQNIESEIFLNRIAKRTVEERPDLPIFTIHDSIVTTVGDEDYVEQVMKEELQNAVGLVPNTKREYWRS
ncbi:hypothetical protein GCM10023189_32410 [Nibrella saemangeumensis]|uniref:DNA-directed DNA polymerase family A palm domain-containing protein n=1 Tax=Nibrella saemangeumensis TaxID=1084526 RepID=A0ABP8N0B1_9BACT